jgi:indolepyruvate ferredoxin oxidoreductase
VHKVNLRGVALDDKYTAQSGRILLSGAQALVRLPILQSRRDAAAGLRTAGFITGYRGSPVGGYDRELWRARKFLEAHRIHFQPGVNEDLAATAVTGTQQIGLFPGARYDGVFATWYGKGPGVDRSGDAFKHGNLSGTMRAGGVLLVFGDDHGAKSSTIAHQSDQAMIAAMVPTLYPANVQEVLEFGLLGWSLSRYSGLFVGLKCVNETVEASATVDADPLQRTLAWPEDVERPPEGLDVNARFEPIRAEQRLVRYKLPMALRFARANRLDRTVFAGSQRRLGIVTAGKAYVDVRQALDRLGLDAARAADLGIGLYKVGMTWPLEGEGLRKFAAGYDELLFVEEKRALLEEQGARVLYSLPQVQRPRLVGKLDECGRPLLPPDGALDPVEIACVVAARLANLEVRDDDVARRAEALRRMRSESRSELPATRTPYFCSGCPHSTSTRVPEGSLAMAGIGCSHMAVWMERSTLTSMQMGGEGANWIGVAPFTDTPHVFQNMGDGTYFHSGLLAIRAAVAAGVNVTYKLLFNGAVAMTGGQPVDGPLSLAQLTRQLAAESVAAIVVVSDEPEKYDRGERLADGVKVRHRRDLDAVQRELRATPGTTVLVYDQACATEKRRARSRGKLPPAETRVFINSAVCEGCGDCSRKSNCVSVLPLETEHGLKRQIDQSACNADYSCLEGFCPAFVTVRGVRPRRVRPDVDPQLAIDDLPEPVPAAAPGSILITGIGGTGVVTLSAILGMAAHLEEKSCSVYDMTGLAQKNGAVLSHVRIDTDPRAEHAVRIGAGEASVVLACDLLVAASGDALGAIAPGRTHVVGNRHVAPTGRFQVDGSLPPAAAELERRLEDAAGPGRVDCIDATGLAVSQLGDAVYSNLLLLGFASQRGLLPVSRAAIERAIELNAVAVDANRRAFDLGRRAALGAKSVSAPGAQTPSSGPAAATLADVVASRRQFLRDYQDDRYAERYARFVAHVADAEARVMGAPGVLADGVARSLFKLMACKDEYEVARLHTSEAFRRELAAQFEGTPKPSYLLAPPALAWGGGAPRKRTFGPWFRPVLQVLARFRRLRGTPFDPFGYTSERREERRLIESYCSTVTRLLTTLQAGNHGLAVEIARLPLDMRGFGAVRARNVREALDRQAVLLMRYEAATSPGTKIDEGDLRKIPETGT